MAEWKGRKYFAFLADRPHIRIAICTVQGQTKYAIYNRKRLVSVELDKDKAKRIAEGL